MSFSKKGYRESLKQKVKLTRKHINRFYEILHELDDIAKKIYKKYPKECTNGFWDDKNIELPIKEFSNLTIGKMEKNIVLSKLNAFVKNDN